MRVGESELPYPLFLRALFLLLFVGPLVMAGLAADRADLISSRLRGATCSGYFFQPVLEADLAQLRDLIFGSIRAGRGALPHGPL
jgi:hypothetical protein